MTTNVLDTLNVEMAIIKKIIVMLPLNPELIVVMIQTMWRLQLSIQVSRMYHYVRPQATYRPQIMYLMSVTHH